MISSSMRSDSRSFPSVAARSMLSVPMTRSWRMMGTQMKERRSWRRWEPVRLRKRGSALMSLTTSARPVFATLPVMPSPTR